MPINISFEEENKADSALIQAIGFCDFSAMQLLLRANKLPLPQHKFFLEEAQKAILVADFETAHHYFNLHHYGASFRSEDLYQLIQGAIKGQQWCFASQVRRHCQEFGHDEAKTLNELLKKTIEAKGSEEERNCLIQADKTAVQYHTDCPILLARRMQLLEALDSSLHDLSDERFSQIEEAIQQRSWLAVSEARLQFHQHYRLEQEAVSSLITLIQTTVQNTGNEAEKQAWSDITQGQAIASHSVLSQQNKWFERLEFLGACILKLQNCLSVVSEHLPLLSPVIGASSTQSFFSISPTTTCTSPHSSQAAKNP